MAAAALLNRLGQPLSLRLTLIERLGDTPPPELGEDQLYGLALRSRPLMKMAELEISMQEKNLRIIRSGLLPSVGVEGQYGYAAGDYDYLHTDWRKDWSVMLKLDMTVFDGLTIRGKLQEERANLDKYLLNRDSVADAVALEVKQALLNFGSAKELLDSQAENVKQAERYLWEEHLRREQGESTYLDILNARQSLARAQNNYFGALYKKAAAKLSLLLAVGVLDEGWEEAGDCRPVTCAARPAPNPRDDPCLYSSEQNPFANLPTPTAPNPQP